MLETIRRHFFGRASGQAPATSLIPNPDQASFGPASAGVGVAAPGSLLADHAVVSKE